jgi:hydroxypyruvate reductase
MTPRELLLDCYRAALAAVDARRCVREDLLRRPPRGSWHVVAVGKAAGSMTLGAVDALGTRLAGGFVVVPPQHLPPELERGARGLLVATAAHPLPDESSLEAGERLARYVASLPPDAPVLFLVSGGASSLVECLRPGCTLEDLRRLNRWALASGASIAQVNALRCRFSRLKGGGLAALARPRRTLALMVSDVPRDDPRVIGSGLLHAGAPAARRDIPLPPELRATLDRLAAAPGDTAAASESRVPVRMVATLRMACRAAAARARECEADAAVVSPRRLAGPAARLGRTLAARVAALPARTLQVWGGESTVCLPAEPGRGGRNQHLALAAAIEFERAGAAGVALLAAGTDGIDGATADAGAVVDEGSCLRGRDGGLDPHVSLATADSGSFLEAAGDLLHTGPTLTNVGDLVLGYAIEGAR